MVVLGGSNLELLHRVHALVYFEFSVLSSNNS